MNPVYQKYLKSDEWKNLKALKESKSFKRCAICAVTSKIDLHHLFYRPDLGDTQTSDLRWLCRRCHDLAHKLIKGGLLKMKKDWSHHRMFAATKHRVRAALCDVRSRIDNDHPMAKRIDALRTGAAGWKRTALETLGVPWPPPKGWRKALIREAMDKDLKAVIT